MRKYCTLILFFIFSLSVMAQTHAVQGRVVNQDNGELLEMATVRLFSYAHGDSTLVQGLQTDQNGGFILHVQNGKYKLHVSTVGYFGKVVDVTVADKDVNLKSIGLKEDVQTLGEVQVRGTAAEMTVRGDTLEYNASAYKMHENAMVEDMLKKMSGVEVDKDGKVTINGEEIKGVRIDGKKFFGDDVQAATKNIPADMIDKIQVIDNKSDMAKLTGIEDDDTERIINLTLKSNKKKGLFGNFTGALGADALGDDQTQLFHYNYQGTPAQKAGQFFREDFRYNANAFMNILSGESQTTIMASANNTNELRSGRGRGGWGNNSGITRTENLGVNTNVILSPKWTFGGDVQLGHNTNTTQTESEKKSNTIGMRYLNSDSTSKLSQSWSANARLEFEYEMDSLNKFIIKPNMSYTHQWSNQYNDYLTQAEDTLLQDGSLLTLSEGNQHNESLSQNIDASLQVLYNHKFQKKGRSLSMDARVGFSGSNSDGINIAEGTVSLNQQQLKKSDNINYSLKLTYIEPIWSVNHFLELDAYFGQTYRKSDKVQNNFNALTEAYDQKDDEYSNTFTNNYLNEQLEVGYRYLKDAYDLSVGVRVNPTQTHSNTTYATGVVIDTLRTVWNFAPRMTFKYQMGKKQFARIIYRGNSQQPSITQMEPVRDNSNAMSETVGNLGLNPAFRHMVRVMYSKFNQEKLSSLNTGLRANLTKDALVNNSIYDETGKVYRQTVNAESLPYDVSADLMYNTPILKNRLHFFTRTEIGYNERLSYQQRGVSSAEIIEMIDKGDFILGNASRTGNVRMREDLSLRFSHDVVDMGIRGNLTYSRTQNTLSAQVNNTLDWGVTADFTFHLPYNWAISTDIGYNDKWGYQLQGSMREIMWNARIDKTWRVGTLSLNMFDILNQKKNVIETIDGDYIQYQRFNTLPTYFTLSFTYKINKMGDLKAKGAGGWMQDMIEGGGRPGGTRGGGMPPMGPPPGRF